MALHSAWLFIGREERESFKKEKSNKYFNKNKHQRDGEREEYIYILFQLNKRK